MNGRVPALRPTQHIGRHLAQINLFREPDGRIFMTVASAPAAIEEQTPEVNASNLVAIWVEEAAPRFVAAWRDWKRGKPQDHP